MKNARLELKVRKARRDKLEKTKDTPPKPLKLSDVIRQTLKLKIGR